VFVSSPGKLALIKSVEHEPEIDDILRTIGPDFDIVLAEGFKRSKLPKIEVYRGDLGGELVCPSGELLAVVTDAQLDAGVARLSMNDTGAIADLIEQSVVRPVQAGGVRSPVANEEEL
jgi:molybdopterin-guanine dinucleotide biosynthesis protein MobB